MGDALSHSVVPGVAGAYALGFPYAIGAFGTGILAALCMTLLRHFTKLREDAIIGFVFSTFFALGLLLVSLNPTSVNVQSILFGNILGIDDADILQVQIIVGVSLLVLAQEVTPGGKGSVTVPSLDVKPGESFPVRIDLRLMRPLAAPAAALVEVGLDGVLFEDLTFFGPNRLNAKRTMLAWEMEARRDRKALLSALESGGQDALRAQLLAALARRDAQPQMSMQVARALPATNVDAERTVSFAFLHLPESPVELLSGEAHMAGQEARAPRIDVQNRGRKPIRYLELGWLVKDGGGREYPAGTLPAELFLAPGQQTTIRKDNTLRFARPVTGLTAYPAVVEFSDGEMWIPPQSAMRDPRLASVLPVSGEMLRIAGLYRRKGIDAVVQQLRSMR